MMVCSKCGAWVDPEIDHAAQSVQCPECNHIDPRRCLPVFIVTGASGTGKTTVVAELQRRLPFWDVFETDILWDSGRDWQTVKCNWLRIAHSLAQSERPVILCGSMQRDQLDHCESRAFFPAIYYLALHCASETLTERLRARPAWRGCDESFIVEHVRYNRWFLDNAQTAFDPPLALIDTTHRPPAEVADEITAWATELWEQALREYRSP